MSARELQGLDTQDAGRPLRLSSRRGAIVSARDVEAADVRPLLQLRDVGAERLALWPPSRRHLLGKIGRAVVVVAIDRRFLRDDGTTLFVEREPVGVIGAQTGRWLAGRGRIRPVVVTR